MQLRCCRGWRCWNELCEQHRGSRHSQHLSVARPSSVHSHPSRAATPRAEGDAAAPSSALSCGHHHPSSPFIPPLRTHARPFPLPVPTHALRGRRTTWRRQQRHGEQTTDAGEATAGRGLNEREVLPSDSRPNANARELQNPPFCFANLDPFCQGPFSPLPIVPCLAQFCLRRTFPLPPPAHLIYPPSPPRPDQAARPAHRHPSRVCPRPCAASSPANTTNQAPAFEISTD